GALAGADDFALGREDDCRTCAMRRWSDSTLPSEYARQCHPDAGQLCTCPAARRTITIAACCIGYSLSVCPRKRRLYRRGETHALRTFAIFGSMGRGDGCSRGDCFGERLPG